MANILNIEDYNGTPGLKWDKITPKPQVSFQCSFCGGDVLSNQEFHILRGIEIKGKIQFTANNAGSPIRACQGCGTQMGLEW